MASGKVFKVYSLVLSSCYVTYKRFSSSAIAGVCFIWNFAKLTYKFKFLTYKLTYNSEFCEIDLQIYLKDYKFNLGMYEVVNLERYFKKRSNDDGGKFFTRVMVWVYEIGFRVESGGCPQQTIFKTKRHSTKLIYSALPLKLLQIDLYI
jgi:hypothetical protein